MAYIVAGAGVLSGFDKFQELYIKWRLGDYCDQFVFKNLKRQSQLQQTTNFVISFLIWGVKKGLTFLNIVKISIKSTIYTALRTLHFIVDKLQSTLYAFKHIQFSPFKRLCLGPIGMNHVVSESCYKGTILRRNYRKITI